MQDKILACYSDYMSDKCASLVHEHLDMTVIHVVNVFVILVSSDCDTAPGNGTNTI